MDNQEIVCYCTYCHNPIYSTDTYVVRMGNPYHKDCFKLIETEKADDYFDNGT